MQMERVHDRKHLISDAICVGIYLIFSSISIFEEELVWKYSVRYISENFTKNSSP